jgi:hypothetical protein
MQRLCPSLDLSDLDLRRLDVLGRRIAERAARFEPEEAMRVAREAAYTIVGFGVLAFQRAQVQRRAIVDSLQTNAPTYLADVSQQASTTLDEVRTLVNMVLHPNDSQR